jgi:putative transposase
MKQGQFSQEQIVGILQQAERGEQTIQAICREHAITETTFYRWRKIYGGMSVSESKRLNELERETAVSSASWRSGIWKSIVSRSTWQKSRHSPGETGTAELPDLARLLRPACLPTA